jgi:uncharacterized membrane protein HdeD (DUF308 family)
VVSLVLGLIAFANVLAATFVSVLYLGILMIVAGALRLSAGIRSRQLDGWGWLIISGAITLLVGIVLALGWPANALWALGTLLAADLTIQGFTALMFGLTLRPRR